MRVTNLASEGQALYDSVGMKRSRGAQTAAKVATWVGFLYVAIQLHAFLGFGGYEVGENHVDKLALTRLGQSVRERVRESEQTFDLDGNDYGLKADNVEPAKPPPPPPLPKPEEKKKVEEKKKPDEVAKKEPKKPEEKKKVPLLVKTDEKKKPEQQVVPVVPDKRIAVKQHVQPNQEDNPNANFLGNEANHVEKETVATQTAHDQDAPDPTPGGNHSGPDKRTGDSDQTKIAESEDHAGEKRKAPGERGTEFDIQPDPTPIRRTMAGNRNTQPMPGGDGRSPSDVNNSQNPFMPQAGDQQSPDVTSAENGGWTFNPLRPGATPTLAPHPCQSTPNNPCPGDGTAQNDKSGKPRSSVSWLGLGGTPGPGQVNLNMNVNGVVAAVGVDQLRKERVADGERRKSEHRGSWQASSFERWRSAIENYVSSVAPGNMTALNTAASPFATYLNGMHNRIHPIFADDFLGSLASLPPTHPMNDPKIYTNLEIVLTPDGNIVKMGVTRTSGITAFDIAALDAVQRASPFGPAPSAIVSPDGRVYLHWEFHRDEVFACSTMNARPIMLKQAPAGTTPPAKTPTAPPPANPEKGSGGVPGQNTNDTREGAILRPMEPRG